MMNVRKKKKIIHYTLIYLLFHLIPFLRNLGLISQLFLPNTNFMWFRISENQ